ILRNHDALGNGGRTVPPGEREGGAGGNYPIAENSNRAGGFARPGAGGGGERQRLGGWAGGQARGRRGRRAERGSAAGGGGRAGGGEVSVADRGGVFGQRQWRHLAPSGRIEQAELDAVRSG